MLCSRAFARSGCKTVHACLAHTTFALLSCIDSPRTLWSKHLRVCTRCVVSQAAGLCSVACDHKRVRRSSVRTFEEERTKSLWNHSACRGLSAECKFFLSRSNEQAGNRGKPRCKPCTPASLSSTTMLPVLRLLFSPLCSQLVRLLDVMHISRR